MTAPENLSRTRALSAFRRRVDAFFGDPHAAPFASALTPATAARAPLTTEGALNSPLSEVLGRLGAESTGDAFRLQKSLTLHDGRVVSMTGDAKPLAADKDVRLVTTTTTVLKMLMNLRTPIAVRDSRVAAAAGAPMPNPPTTPTVPLVLSKR